MLVQRNQYLENAINRAAQSHNHVRRIAPDTYRVVSGSSMDGYVVFLSKKEDGLHAECNCAAGSYDKICHHVVSAGWLHKAIIRMERRTR